MSTPTLVPASDRAPSLASRVVSIHATDVTEGAPAPDHVTFALPYALRVPKDDVILRPGGVTVRLVDGHAQVRLPVYSTAVQTVDSSTDWVILVRPSWGGEYPIRVPAGSSAISLADLPAVRPLTRREQEYALTGVGVTVTEGANAGGSASYANGQLDLKIQVPSFRPQTVYPYIDETAEARAEQYGREIRTDLDNRLAEVTTAYELAVADGYEGTLTQWLASLRGPKGDKGDASTVPGPPNSLSIGTVETGAAGSNAAATITGTPPSQVLGLTIPRGDKGDKGDDSKVPGPTGKTAYEYAQDAGFTGTEEEFAAAQLPDTITWENVDGKPTVYPPEAHGHGWADITDPPASFPPAQHTHAIADVDGLQAALGDDTGWVDLTLESGFTYNGGVGAPPQARRINDVVYLRGRVARDEGNFDAGTNFVFLTLPPQFRPPYNGRYLLGGGNSSQWGRADVVASSGEIGFAAISGDLGWVDLNALTWLAN